MVAVNVCGAEVVPTGTEPKLRLEAERVSEEVVPVRFMDWGLPGALSVNRILAVPTPVVVGVNVTVTVHCAPGASVLGQFVVCAKSPEFGPVGAPTVKPVRVLSPFVMVTVSGALVVPKLCAGKTSDDGLS